jgi:1-acyl-sn-glycerol-3-phosphate acyltransferase
MSRHQISYIRTFLGWTFGVPWTICMSTVAILSFLIARSGTVVHGCGGVWSRVLLWVTGMTVEMTGLENVPSGHSVLIVSNHQSMCDILVVCGYLPLRFSFIAKRELFRIPLLGPAMKAANYVPIDRANREKAYRSLEDAANVLKNHSVLIFPEGTRTRTGALGKFKHGAVHLLVSSGVPVLPITITNSFERVPPGRFGIVPGTIHVRIDPEIVTDGMNKREILKVMQTIRHQMEERIDASSEPVN